MRERREVEEKEGGNLLLSRLLNRITDSGLQMVLRTIIFHDDNNFSDKDKLDLIQKYMPEELPRRIK